MTEPVASSSRRGRRLHSKKAKRARRLANELSHQLAAPTSSSSADVAKLVKQLTPVLASLRKATLQQNRPHAKLVASGIADLTLAYEKLAEANRVSNPDAAFRQLSKGHRALENATSKAQKAGDAWPL